MTLVAKKKDIATCLANRATSALKEEALLTPKPGLVDANDNGAHSDMHLSMMLRSAEVLYDCFHEIASISYLHPVNQELREKIAAVGQEGEKAMYTATNGVNTHKGAIWALGLLVSARATFKEIKSPAHILQTAGEIARYEDRYSKKSMSNGKRVKRRYNVVTALDEARLGFPQIRYNSLPFMVKLIAQGNTRSFSAHMALMSLIANVDDTCVLHRSHLDDLLLLQSFATSFIEANGFKTKKGHKIYQNMDDFCNKKGLSPGGSADLLAATLFLLDDE